MRAINVFLSVVVSFLIGVAVLELGLRLIGGAPQPTINRFDPVLGWSKTPNSHGSRTTSEFDVAYEINEQGLRDDPMPSRAKPSGTFRVVALGDSFVLGYTVNREDLFVDQLEGWWKSEGRAIDVVNAGTEAWSTDQEVVWLKSVGKDFQPDLVLLFPYENDLFWNTQDRYLRFPKPRFNTTGSLEATHLADPGERRWYESFALGKSIAGAKTPLPTWLPNGKRRLPMEQGAYWLEAPEFMKQARARTKSALQVLAEECRALNAKLVVAPIPGKACIHDDARTLLIDEIQNRSALSSLRRSITGDPDPEADPMLSTKAWSPEAPVELFLAVCTELGITALDARPALRDAAKTDGELYYRADWHLTPAGNRAFARYLHTELDKPTDGVASTLLPKAERTGSIPAPAEKPWRVPTAVFWFAGLWLFLGFTFTQMYRDWPAWKGFLGVGAMLGLIFTIALGGGALIGKLPPQWSRLAIFVFLFALFVFVLAKLGRKLGTIVELLTSFTRRGHWYLMPLVVVLLSIGSLLVVAASSPLVAPFIYTLF